MLRVPRFIRINSWFQRPAFKFKAGPGAHWPGVQGGPGRPLCIRGPWSDGKRSALRAGPALNAPGPPNLAGPGYIWGPWSNGKRSALCAVRGETALAAAAADRSADALRGPTRRARRRFGGPGRCGSAYIGAAYIGARHAIPCVSAAAAHTYPAVPPKRRIASGADSEGPAPQRPCFAGKSPSFAGKSPCVTGKSPYVTGRSPCFAGKSPCFAGRSPCVTGGSLFVTGGSRCFTGRSRVAGPPASRPGRTAAQTVMRNLHFLAPDSDFKLVRSVFHWQEPPAFESDGRVGRRSPGRRHWLAFAGRALSPGAASSPRTSHAHVADCWRLGHPQAGVRQAPLRRHRACENDLTISAIHDWI